MSRDYGRVRVSFWESESIRPLAPEHKFVGLYLLTSPHTNAIGCFRLPIAYVGHDTGMTPRQLEIAFAALRSAGLMQWCERLPWIWLPNYLKHNPPENPNVWRKCVKELEALPAISAQAHIAQELYAIADEPRMRNPNSKTSVSDEERDRLIPFLNGIDTVPKGSRPCPVPSPEPEPIPEPPSLRSGEAPPPEGKPVSKPVRPKKNKTPLPGDRPNADDRCWAIDQWGKKNRTDIIKNLPAIAQKFRDYHLKEGTLSADWDASWRYWAGNEIKPEKRNGYAGKPNRFDETIEGIRDFVGTGSEPAFEDPPGGAEPTLAPSSPRRIGTSGQDTPDDHERSSSPSPGAARNHLRLAVDRSERPGGEVPDFLRCAAPVYGAGSSSGSGAVSSEDRSSAPILSETCRTFGPR